MYQTMSKASESEHSSIAGHGAAMCQHTHQFRSLDDLCLWHPSAHMETFREVLQERLLLLDPPKITEANGKTQAKEQNT